MAVLSPTAPRLLSISPPGPEAAGRWVSRAPELVEVGAEALLLRLCPDRGDQADARAEMETTARRWTEHLAALGLPLLVHLKTPGAEALATRLDLGLHLPAGVEAGAFVGRFAALGQSCHSLVELRRAAAAGCTYATLSPVFRPRSKVDLRPVLGISGLRECCVALGSSLPVLALGGIVPPQVQACLAGGAQGIAGIGMFGSVDAVAAMKSALSVYAPPV